VPGAVVATVGIFLPAFVLVAVTNPWVPRLRQSAFFSHLLDGVNAAALGLMAAVTLQLARASLVGPLTLALALAAAFLLLRFKPNATWLVLGGAVVGLLASAFAR
jgi:chromate transporter